MDNEKDHERRFAEGTKDMEYLSFGINGECPECASDWDMEQDDFRQEVQNGNVFDEGSFSSCQCGLCGSRLGGQRYVYHWMMNGELCHDDDACEDCLLLGA